LVLGEPSPGVLVTLLFSRKKTKIKKNKKKKNKKKKTKEKKQNKKKQKNKTKQKNKKGKAKKKMEFVKVAVWQEEAVYEIICFDDGNDCLVRFPNEWRIVATNLRGKVRLENVRTGYTVQSISEWKVTQCR